jgi:hypothetical protein
MKRISPSLPKWVDYFTTLGFERVDGTLTDESAIWFFLTACCPLIFESYAVLFHPFMVNWKLKNEIDSGKSIQKERNLTDFESVSWKDFFKLNAKEFDIKTAYTTHEDIAEILRNGPKIANFEPLGNTGWPPYILYPAQGNAPFEDLSIIINDIMRIHNDQVVSYYYFLLNTKDPMLGNIAFEGTLSEFEKLKQPDNIDDTPTIIYPPTKKWCIISDFDTPFTYLGGSTELINAITSHKELEVYKLEPRFKIKAT